MIRYTISKDRDALIRPWRVHMIDIDAGTITLIAMRQTWATCCSWLQRRIAAAEQPESATPPRSVRGLIVGNGMRREPGRETNALYCDECGELTCGHRPEFGAAEQPEPARKEDDRG